MKRILSIVLLIFPSLLFGQIGKLEYSQSHVSNLLNSEVSSSERQSNLQEYLEITPFAIENKKYISELKKDPNWDTPDFDKYRVYESALIALESKNETEALQSMHQYIDLLDQDQRLMGMNSPLGSARIFYRQFSKNLQMVKYYKNKLSKYETDGPAKSAATCHYVLGGNYFFAGDYNLAIKHLLLATELLDENTEPKMMGELYACIGDSYRSWGNEDKAIEYLNKAIYILEKNNAFGFLAFSELILSKIYKKKGEFISALEHASKVKKLGDEKRIKKVFRANAILQMADIYIIQEQPALALQYLKQASSIQNKNSLSMNGEAGDFELDYTYYKYFSSKGNLEKAESHLLKALDVASESHILKLVNKYQKELYYFYANEDNSDLAIEYAGQHIYLSDSLERLKKVKSIAQYESEKKEEFAKQALLTVEEKRQHQRKNFLFAGAILSFLLIGAILRIRLIRNSRIAIQKERDRSDELLLNILPVEVADELKAKGKVAAREYKNVTVLFSDLVDFTSKAEKMTPDVLIEELNICFKAFDQIMEKNNVEKIKTIGDAYMCAGGMHDDPATAAKRVVAAGLEMQAFVEDRRKAIPDLAGSRFQMRIGIHTGNVIAGIVGLKKFQYDLWGDTINVASRMETNSHTGMVNISEATYSLIKNQKELSFDSRGDVDVKGKGKMQMFFVEKIHSESVLD